MGIEWKKGAACYAGGKQWNSILQNDVIIALDDFQLNEIRQGDYIEASELDTEKKYNDVVEVFELYGLECHASYSLLKSYGNLYVESGTEVYACTDESESAERKITYTQLMAIGKLKRAMIECDEVERGKLKHSVRFKSPPLDASGFNTVEQSREKRARRNKSKQAYGILKSLDYEYDLDKQKWYKKQFV